MSPSNLRTTFLPPSGRLNGSSSEESSIILVSACPKLANTPSGSSSVSSRLGPGLEASPTRTPRNPNRENINATHLLIMSTVQWLPNNVSWHLPRRSLEDLERPSIGTSPTNVSICAVPWKTIGNHHGISKLHGIAEVAIPIAHPTSEILPIRERHPEVEDHCPSTFPEPPRGLTHSKGVELCFCKSSTADTTGPSGIEMASKKSRAGLCDLCLVNGFLL